MSATGLTRRQLLQTTAAVALATGLPEAAKAGFFHGGVASGSPPLLPPVITSSLTLNATQGSPVFYQITATNSPTSFGASGLPGGLSVNTSNGQITGTPTTVATTSGSISATNSAGTGSVTLTIVVAATGTGTTLMAAAMAADILARSNYSYSGNPVDKQAPNLYLASWTQNRPGAQYASVSSLTASSFPTTMTLVQDGTIAGGVPTQSFGWVFRPGDIPAGHAPLFKVGGITWPYSAGLQTYWPDGSLKWAAFSLMVPSGFAPALNSSTTVDISDGGFGTWPAASGRTLSEVYAQNLVVNGPMPSPNVTNNARSTGLVAAVNGDSNQYYAVKDLDGAAGARWTIKCRMSTSIGGTADTNYVVRFRIHALNNVTGGLGGFRWGAEIANPFYPTTGKTYLSFAAPNTGSPSAGLNWSINPSGTTIYNAVYFPFRTIDWSNGASFTGSVTGNVLTVTSVAYGHLTCGDPNVICSIAGGTNEITVSGFSSPPGIALSGYSSTFFVLDGALNDVFGVNSLATTTDEGLGWEGQYTTRNAATATLVNQPVLVTSTGGALSDGGALTGQFSIQGQLTTSGGDAPGLRGTYQLTGSVGSPIGSSAMTTIGQVTSTPLNDYWAGGQSGNTVGGVITGAHLPTVSSGSIPGGNPCTGLSNGLAFVSSTVMSNATYPNTVTPAIGIGAGQWCGSYGWGFDTPGEGTFTPLPGLAPYCRFVISNADGRYNFFRGTGSIASETTLRVQINQAYWQSTSTFMAMDMSYVGAIPDSFFGFPWKPNTLGMVRTYGVDDYGPPIEIGLNPTTNGWDFYVQSKTTEREVRSFATYVANTTADFKSNAGGTLDRIPPMYGTGAAYAGLPACLGPNPSFYPNSSTNGPTKGADYSPLGLEYGRGSVNPTHSPNPWYWAYLRFGEMQYFDYGVEYMQYMCAAQRTDIWSGGGFFNSPPYPYLTNANILIGGQQRGCGWANLHLQTVAFICSNDPSNNANNPTFSDGTQLQRYILDYADDQPRMAVAVRDGTGAAVPATLWGTTRAADYVKARGFWQNTYGAFTEIVYSQTQPWELFGYMMGSMLFASLRGNADATNLISGMMNFCDHIGNNSPLHKGTSANGYYHFYNIAANCFEQAPDICHTNVIGPFMSDDRMFCVANGFIVPYNPNPYNSFAAPYDWVPSSSVAPGAGCFTLYGTFPGPWYNQNLPNYPRDGDAILVNQNGPEGGPWPSWYCQNSPTIPAGLTQNQVYYIRDLSPTNTQTGPWTFNFAATQGGPAIPITNSPGAGNFLLANTQYFAAAPDPLSSEGPGYICQVGNWVNWLHAICTSPYGHNTFAQFT